MNNLMPRMSYCSPQTLHLAQFEINQLPMKIAREAILQLFME